MAKQPIVRDKSVHSPINAEFDGFRVLAARFRGRGLSTDVYDAWMPNLGPSEELLRSFQSGAIGWAEFKRRYRDELFEDSPLDARNRTIKNHGQKFTLRLLQEIARRGPVTVMCHCAEEQEHCHRHLLKGILEREI